MLRRIVSGSSLLAVLLTAVAARAEGPLDVIPQTASVLLRLKAPDATTQKVAEFANKIDPTAGQQVQNFSPFLGMLISNPTMAGVDRTKDWHVAVFARSEQQPALVFVIPAKDANAMQQALGQQFTAFTQGDYLVYSEDAQIIEEIRSRGEGESITKAISQSSQEVIDGSDVSIYLNVPRLREVYKAQLDSAREQVDQLIEQMKLFTPPQQGVDMGQIFEMYGRVAHGVLQAIDDAKGLTIALSVKPEAVSFVDYAEFTSESSTSKYLAESEPGKVEILQKLPSGKLLYAASEGGTGDLTRWGMEMGMQMYEEDESKKEALEEVKKELQELEFGGFAMALELGDPAQGAVRAYSLMEVKPIERMRDVSRQSVKELGDLEHPSGFKQTSELKQEAERYGSHTADVVTVKQEFDPQNGEEGAIGGAGMEQMMQALWGPEGMTQRFIYMKAGDLLVQTIGGNRASMEQLLKAVEGSGSSEGAVASTRRGLSEQANFLGLLDVPRMIVEGTRIAVQSGAPIPVDAQQLDALKIEPSYAGLSVHMGDSAVRVTTYVPVEQIQGTVKIVQTFMQQMQNQQQQF